MDYLLDKEKQFTNLLSVLPDVVIIHGNGIILYANQAACIATEYSLDELLGSHVLTYVVKEDRDLVIKNLERRRAGEIVGDYECGLIRKSGEISTAIVRPTDTFFNGQPVVLLILIDITDRKRVEAEMLKINKELEAIISASPDGIGIISLDGKIQFLSDKIIELYGYSVAQKDEFMGRSSFDFIDPSEHEKLINNMSQLISGKHNLNLSEYIGVKKDKSRFYIEVNSTVLQDANGIPAGILFVERDITERKRIGEEIKKTNLELAKLNSEKDKLFSIIAHDLRSPFHGLLGLTELMENESYKLSSEEITRFSKELHISVVNLYTLLENILEWAQLQKGSISFKPDTLSLYNIFSQCIDSIKQRAAQKEITIFNEIPQNLNIYADEKMINSVLRNLLSNAVKFTKKRGMVVGKASDLKNGSIEVSVTDNGVGIHDDVIRKLFKLGEKVGSKGTENEPSTGLGLLISKEFIDKHNGKIWVESRENVGSTFYFTLQTN